jgi:hypothetical protein
MQGHVMPSFPHTLIGLGPFANLSCQIFFTKTAVSVIHQDGHIILEGWREVDSPHLWRFPLQATQSSLPATALFDKYDKPGPRRSAANFSLAPPIIPIQCPPAAPTPSPHRPPPMASTTLLQPSQGFSTIDDAGRACFVSYQYRAAQALALAARSSTTPFNPCSLDLPSVGALIGFYHACLGFPVKQTWLEAIKAGNCDSFDGLTYSNVARYCLDVDETIMGHLTQQCQNVCSTKPKPPAPNQAPLTPAISPQASTLPSNEVYICVYPISKLYTDNTGRFFIKAHSGNQYVMIAYHADGNLILQQAFKSRSNTHCIAAYNAIMTRLAARGLSVDLQILDNKAIAATSMPSPLHGKPSFSWSLWICIAGTMLSKQSERSRPTFFPSWLG